MSEQPHHDTADKRHATGTSGQRPDAGLARQLSDLARELHAETDTGALLQRITVAAVSEVAGAQSAGISLVEKRTVRTVAATDDLVETIDREQYRLQEGPCLTTLREHTTVRTDDLSTEQRWPNFAATVTAFGIGSMLAVQLFVEDDTLGSINMYATEPHAFTDDDESTALLLASHAAIAMKGNEVEGNLRTALEWRDVIGQAKGILMERYKIGPGEAFDLMVMASQRTHTKVRLVAERVATTGELRAD